jgi:hypothetical protein
LLIKPQPKQAKFLSSSADIVIYGGAAGGGKSYSLLLEPLRYITTVPDYNAVFFRRTYPEIINPGGLWDTANSIYSDPIFKAYSVEKSWKFRLNNSSNENKIVFSHLQHEKDKFSWQGSQIALICFDELTHFSQEQFFYLMSRNRSLCGVKPTIRATCNPDPESWVKNFINPWISDEGFPIPELDGKIKFILRRNGVIHYSNSFKEMKNKFPEININDIKTLTFISANIEDNQILQKLNPEYKSNLLAQTQYEQDLLLHGNWNAKRQTGDTFKELQFTNYDDSIQSVAFLDPAYDGNNHTSLTIGYKKEDNYFCKGFTWRKNVVDLEEEILLILSENNCLKLFFENNADKGIGARSYTQAKEKLLNSENIPQDLKNRLYSINIIPISAGKENKHIRIYSYAKKHLEKIYFANNNQSLYIQRLKNYSYGVDLDDDEADSLAGVIKRFLVSPLIISVSAN